MKTTNILQNGDVVFYIHLSSPPHHSPFSQNIQFIFGLIKVNKSINLIYYSLVKIMLEYKL